MRGIDGRDYESLRGWLIFEDGTWRAHKDHCPCSRRGPGPLSGRSRHEPAGKTGWIGIRSRIWRSSRAPPLFRKASAGHCAMAECDPKRPSHEAPIWYRVQSASHRNTAVENDFWIALSAKQGVIWLTQLRRRFISTTGIQSLVTLYSRSSAKAAAI